MRSLPCRIPLLLIAALACLTAGCSHQNAATTTITAPPLKPVISAPGTIATSATETTKAELESAGVNELGYIPVLEFHEIVPDTVKPVKYQYRISDFRRVMRRMYDDGYRPINLTELVTGHIDCPIGYTPFVVTFDDALPGQIDYTPEGKIDPNCAVGVLLAMHNKHPDWRLAGTFFVLPAKGRTDYFYQQKYSKDKLNWLVDNGFELGNHTVHHLRGMRTWQDSRVESEFAIAAKMIDDNVPGYKVDLLALPFGVYPRKIALVENGSYEGLTYHNICAVRAGYRPAVPPITQEWDPYRIQRIIPGKGRWTIEYWLNILERHKELRFISDGDPGTITVPARLASQVLPSQLQRLGLTLRIY
jgi:hypothetical protein